MKRTTNNILSTLLMATLITACSADRDADGDTPGGGTTPLEAIGFSPAVGGGVTRTAPGTLTLDGYTAGSQSLKRTGFGVFAAHTAQHPLASSSVTADFMYNERLTHDGSEWSYTPLKYWPNPEPGQNADYVSFFAYGPWADPATGEGAAHCITDMSQPYEVGTPWLVYQLADDPQQQVDLLFALTPDRQKPAAAATVPIQLHHALSVAGDRITISASQALRDLVARFPNADPRYTATVELSRITVTYQLTSKARLRLADSQEPQWEAIYSGTPVATRTVTLMPGHELLHNVSTTQTVYNPYVGEDNGVMYIPLKVEQAQTADIELQFTTSLSFTDRAGISTDGDNGTADEGQYAGSFVTTATQSVGLDGVGAGRSVQFAITLDNQLLTIHEPWGDGQLHMFQIPNQELVSTGQAVEPVVVVCNDQGQLLTEGRDYTVSYTGNDRVADIVYDDTDPDNPIITADNRATATATGLGDYAGQTAEQPFVIRLPATGD